MRIVEQLVTRTFPPEKSLNKEGRTLISTYSKVSANSFNQHFLIGTVVGFISRSAFKYATQQLPFKTRVWSGNLIFVVCLSSSLYLWTIKDRELKKPVESEVKEHSFKYLLPQL